VNEEQKPILDVLGLTVQFASIGGRVVKAVQDISFKVGHGDTLAVIGESGCGKSTLALSVLRVLPPAAQIMEGQILFEGEDLLKKTPGEMTRVRGMKMSMILQDSMMSLNPIFTVGDQIGEGLRYHRRLKGNALMQRIEDLLLDVQIPDPRRRIKQWPHEMSGGMRQRIVGAIALSCEPKLIIADEPTTSLDVTIQLQYLDLLRELQEKKGITLIFITHDLGVVAQMCQHVIVMYAGRIVERGPVFDIYDDPAHPYTKGLLEVAFKLSDLMKRTSIAGEPPNLANLPAGCSFHPRCPVADKVCRQEEPPEVTLGHDRTVRCWRYADAQS
jgi:oligopeptide/dipeptide ABC transporter ATP-binding protein